MSPGVGGLFFGSDSVLELFENTVANAPGSRSPIDAVAEALQAAASFFEGRRDQARKRQGAIAANPSLQERELIKLASLAAAVAEALRTRGVGDPAALLTAEAGITVFKVAFDIWVDTSHDRAFADVMRATLDELRAVTGA